MLYQQDPTAELVSDTMDNPCQIFGFVQQQKIRGEHQRPGDADAAFVGIGQARRRQFGKVLRAHPVQQAQRLSLGAATGMPQTHTRHGQIVQHVQPGEEPPRLERARNATAAQDMGRFMSDALPVQQNGPGGGGLIPRQHVDHGGFARAIWPDQPMHGAGSDVQ